MKIGDIICGFKVTDAVCNEELGGTLWKLCHMKTGAELVWLDNQEENKLFAIAFKTIPYDDTGVFHILEHSVLCGSENYPVKEPFLDLLKGSMNTFLNAFTFPDKTMYPVSSRNEQDFINLTSVYLDAVFCPNIYRNPCIFAQEGWHYELGENDKTPTYKGVVYNEMKGAYSSVETLVESEMNKLLFPDNCYKYSSGGDPEHIPELTYEQFTRTHREFYHPTNSKTYLDGDLPIERVLLLIDGYFSKYQKSDAKHEVLMQEDVGSSKAVTYYEIGKEEDESYKAQMSLGRILCDYTDKKKCYAASILASYLTGSNAAPLKRAVLEAGLAQDLWLAINNGTAQVSAVLRIRNTEYENAEAIKDIIKSTCERLISGELDKEELEANINAFEFMLKEPQEPRGVERAITAMNAWLYGGEPEEYLMFEDVLAELRAELHTDYFETLLKEIFLCDEQLCELYTLPSKTEGDRKRKAEEDKLLLAAGAWDENQRADILKQNSEIVAWQTEEDSQAALATIPMLSVSDIGEMPAETPTEMTEYNGVKIMFHPQPTKGVSHLKLYYNIADLPIEKLSLISFVSTLFGELPTQKHSATELQKQIKKNIGALHFGIDAFPVAGAPEKCRLFFTVSISLLEKNMKAALEIVEEILNCTDFDNIDAIREIVYQNGEGMYQAIIESGNKFAALRANRNFDASVAANEKLDGYDMYTFLCDFAGDFDNRIEEVCAFAKDISKNVFVQSRLTVSETAVKRNSELNTFIDRMAAGEVKEIPQYFTPELSKKPVKEAIQIPAGISYAALGSNLIRHNARYNGKYAVLSNILSFGYLWTEIRVLGGAYGCAFAANRAGDIRFSSYRDPSPLRSLEVFKNTSEFIKNFVEGDEDAQRFIISTIASTMPLRSASQKGADADKDYFCDVSYEDKCNTRTQILEFKKEELLSLCPLFEEVANDGSVCIVAHEGVVSALSEEWDKFSL